MFLGNKSNRNRVLHELEDDKVWDQVYQDNDRLSSNLIDDSDHSQDDMLMQILPYDQILRESNKRSLKQLPQFSSENPSSFCGIVRPNKSYNNFGQIPDGSPLQPKQNMNELMRSQIVQNRSNSDVNFEDMKYYDGSFVRRSTHLLYNDSHNRFNSNINNESQIDNIKTEVNFAIDYRHSKIDDGLNQDHQESAQYQISFTNEEGDEEARSQDTHLNDTESNLIQSSLSSVINAAVNYQGGHVTKPQVGTTGNYKKIFDKENKNYFQIKATWIQDNSKSVLVDIDEKENVQFLLRRIGERMEETHDDFRGLRQCQAEYIFQIDQTLKINSLQNDSRKHIGGVNSIIASMNAVNILDPMSLQQQDHPNLRHQSFKVITSNSRKNSTATRSQQVNQPSSLSNNSKFPLNQFDRFQANRLIKNCLKNGDEIFFEIATQDLWLKASILLYLGQQKILKVKACFKFTKITTLANLKKKIQIFGIKLWCHKNTPPDSYNATNPQGQDTTTKRDDEKEEGENLYPVELTIRKAKTMENQENVSQMQESSQDPTGNERHHLLYILDKFKIKSLFAPKYEQYYKKFSDSGEKSPEKNKEQQKQEDHQKFELFDINSMEDFLTVGQIFDYKNYLKIDMHFVPFIQINLMESKLLSDNNKPVSQLEYSLESQNKRVRALSDNYSIQQQIRKQSNNAISSTRSPLSDNDNGVKGRDSSIPSTQIRQLQTSKDFQSLIKLEESKLIEAEGDFQMQINEDASQQIIDRSENNHIEYLCKSATDLKKKNTQPVDQINNDIGLFNSNNTRQSLVNQKSIIFSGIIQNEHGNIGGTDINNIKCDNNKQLGLQSAQIQFSSQNLPQSTWYPNQTSTIVEADKMQKLQQTAKNRNIISKGALPNSQELSSNEQSCLNQQEVKIRKDQEIAYLNELKDIWKNFIDSIMTFTYGDQVIMRGSDRQSQAQFDKIIQAIQQFKDNIMKAQVCLLHDNGDKRHPRHSNIASETQEQARKQPDNLIESKRTRSAILLKFGQRKKRSNSRNNNNLATSAEIQNFAKQLKVSGTFQDPMLLMRNPLLEKTDDEATLSNGNKSAELSKRELAVVGTPVISQINQTKNSSEQPQILGDKNSVKNSRNSILPFGIFRNKSKQGAQNSNIVSPEKPQPLIQIQNLEPSFESPKFSQKKSIVDVTEMERSSKLDKPRKSVIFENQVSFHQIMDNMSPHKSSDKSLNETPDKKEEEKKDYFRFGTNLQSTESKRQGFGNTGQSCDVDDSFVTPSISPFKVYPVLASASPLGMEFGQLSGLDAHTPQIGTTNFLKSHITEDYIQPCSKAESFKAYNGLQVTESNTQNKQRPLKRKFSLFGGSKRKSGGSNSHNILSVMKRKSMLSEHQSVYYSIGQSVSRPLSPKNEFDDGIMTDDENLLEMIKILGSIQILKAFKDFEITDQKQSDDIDSPKESTNPSILMHQLQDVVNIGKKQIAQTLTGEIHDTQMEDIEQEIHYSPFLHPYVVKLDEFNNLRGPQIRKLIIKNIGRNQMGQTPKLWKISEQIIKKNVQKLVFRSGQLSNNQNQNKNFHENFFNFGNTCKITDQNGIKQTHQPMSFGGTNPRNSNLMKVLQTMNKDHTDQQYGGYNDGGLFNQDVYSLSELQSPNFNMLRSNDLETDSADMYQMNFCDSQATFNQFVTERNLKLSQFMDKQRFLDMPDRYDINGQMKRIQRQQRCLKIFVILLCIILISTVLIIVYEVIRMSDLDDIQNYQNDPDY